MSLVLDESKAVDCSLAATTRLVGSSRGDPLTQYLFAALDRRYGLAGQIDTELRPWQRYLVALSTFHPSMVRWKERYWKSLRAFEFRSSNSRTALASFDRPYHAVLQIHALFQTRGAPYLLYVDNTHYQSVQGWPAWNPLRPADLANWYARERAIYRQARHIFTMSQPTTQSLMDFYGIPEDRVTNVGGGANFDSLPPPVCAPREPAILFVGHDFPRKGGERLLEAFRGIRAHVSSARLWIVGASHVQPEPGVEVFGRIDDRHRLADLYARASIFCLPSYFEPFGLALVEAMAYGLPCVSTTVGGIPEIVVHEETGLLVPPGESDALASALLGLIENPEQAARLGEAGRLRVERHLTWDRVVDRMSPVLDRLSAACARRSPRSRR